jgi:protein CpxP
MKFTTKTIAAAALLGALGLGAIAQTPPATPPGPGYGPGPGYEMGHRGMMRGDSAQWRERMERRMAERQAYLKQKLAITPAQEAAWNAWTATMKPPAAPMQRPDRAEFAKLTTPERIDRMRTVRAERQKSMDQRMDATKTFYAALNADQKKVFDQESMRFLGGGKRGMGRHG